jgi:hypothetical protein
MTASRAVRCTAVVGTTVLAVLVLASEATAKLAFDQITVSGPGLDVGVRLRPDDYLDMSVLAEHSGFWTQFGCRRCSTRLTAAPTRVLGPRYVLTYSMPSSFGADTKILATDEVTQYVYPYAEPLPVTFMPPRQRSPGGTSSIGGWYMADQTLTRQLETFGVRPPIPGAVGTPEDDTGFASKRVWLAIGLATLIGLCAVALLIGRRSRRRGLAGRAG